MKSSIAVLLLAGSLFAVGCRHAYEQHPYYCQPQCGCVPACQPACNPCAPGLQPTPTVIPRAGTYVPPPSGGTYTVPGGSTYAAPNPNPNPTMPAR